MRLEFIQLYGPDSGRTYRFYPANFGVTVVGDDYGERSAENGPCALVIRSLVAPLEETLKEARRLVLAWDRTRDK